MKTLVVSTEQAQMMVNALDMHCRTFIGQYADIVTNHDVEFILKQLYHPELSPSSSWGIFNDKVDIVAKRQYDMLQVIRHRLSWDKAGNPEKRNWFTMMTVNFDEPSGVTDEPFLQIKNIGTDTYELCASDLQIEAIKMAVLFYGRIIEKNFDHLVNFEGEKLFWILSKQQSVALDANKVKEMITHHCRNQFFAKPYAEKQLLLCFQTIKLVEEAKEGVS